MRFIAVAVFAALTLSACGLPNGVTKTLKHENHPTTKFTHCSSFGCSTMYKIAFTEAEWAEIGAFFAGTVDAADERARLARAMSRFEQIVGPKDGTDKDKGGTGLFVLDGGPGQLDCYAEAANAGVAVRMMYESGFFKFHVPGEQAMRGPLHSGTTMLDHATATIVETATGHRWAVDGWFFDNGGPVFVVDFDEWIDGWTPKGGAAN